jgi:hypothetical protein
LFDFATNWISRLTRAHHMGRLEQELQRLRRYKLLVLDDIGYLVFDHDAAKLFLRLVAARYEQGTILVASNSPLAGGVSSSPTTSPPRLSTASFIMPKSSRSPASPTAREADANSFARVPPDETKCTKNQAEG